MSSEVYAKIEQQCSWWDMFSRIVPVGGIMMFLAVWYIGRDLVETVIVTGIALICVTFAFWWYWSVRSIAHLARSNWLLHDKMKNIHQELCDAKQELRDIKNELK